MRRSAERIGYKIKDNDGNDANGNAQKWKKMVFEEHDEQSGEKVRKTSWVKVATDSMPEANKNQDGIISLEVDAKLNVKDMIGKKEEPM